MFHSIKNIIKKRQLKDEDYRYLFEPCLKDEYVCFDCETTGLNPKIDDIISIGAVLVKENKIITSEKFERFVKQKNNIPQSSMAIHHIRDCDMDNAQDIDTVIKDFLKFISNKPLIGYNLRFDMRMVDKHIKEKIGISLPNKQIEVANMYDDFMRKLNPSSHINLSFNSILENLDIPMLPKHNATNDAIMTSMIFLSLKKRWT